jgi:hypothetical protein
MHIMVDYLVRDINFVEGDRIVLNVGDDLVINVPRAILVLRN